MRRIVLLLLLLTSPAAADQIGLSPLASTVQLRSYGLGFFPLDGAFTRFRGWIRYEPSNPTACQVVLQIEAASLAMEDSAFQSRVIGPELMDVARYPDLAFSGNCQSDTIAGTLTLHGETHPFALNLERSARAIVATGHLRRADWGITGHPLLGGSTIRIRIKVPNPLAGSPA